MAGAVQRPSWLPFAWQAQYTEPPGGVAARVVARWAAAGFAWQAQSRELPGCLSRGRRSTQSLLEELRRTWAPLGRGWLRVAGAVQRVSWLPFAWQAQYTEPPGGAAARVGAAGPRLASRGRRSTQSLLKKVAARVVARWAAAGFAWQAQYREFPGCLSLGRRSTQSLLEELRPAWAPLGRGWLRVAQYTQPPGGAAAPTCGWLRVAGAVQRASWLPFAWQAQYTEPPGGAAARVGAAGPRLASRGRRSTESFLAHAWQAHYTEPPGGAAARVGAAGPRLASRGRRSTESFLAQAWQAQYTEPPGGAAAARVVARSAAAGFVRQAQ